MDEYPLNRSEPDTSVNAGRQGRIYHPKHRPGAPPAKKSETATTRPDGLRGPLQLWSLRSPFASYDLGGRYFLKPPQSPMSLMKSSMA